MGRLMLLKKFCLLFLLVSASLFATSMAGGRSKFLGKLAGEVDAIQEEVSIIEVDAIQEEGSESMKPPNNEEVMVIHERLLRANTKDYGRYDPSPSLPKPPFKLIPN